MGYKLLKPARRQGGRATETFGITRRHITLNELMIAKLGLRPGDGLVLFESEDGFLTLAVGKPGDANARDLRTARRDKNRPFGSCTLSCYCPGVTRRCRRGRYRITGRDGGFFTTDCRLAPAEEEAV